MPTDALSFPFVPTRSFHGKEGVVGSSPTEGSLVLPWLAGFGSSCRFGDRNRRGRYGNHLETASSGAAWFSSLTGTVYGGLGFAVPQDGFGVRAIPPEPQIIHSPPRDGPGRAVFRRGVPPRSGV